MLLFEHWIGNDRHLRMLLVLVCAGLGILTGGLWYVQVVAGKRYMDDQIAQSFRTVRTPAVRGKILDRNGQALAENRPCYNVSAYLEEFSRRFQTRYTPALVQESARVRQAYNRKLTREERTRVAQETRYLVTSNAAHGLGLLLSQPVTLSPRDFQEHYDQRLALPLPVMRDLNAEQIARLQEQTGVPPGLDLVVQPLRIYPRQSVGAHIVGYLTKDDTSREGEESFFNYRLPDFKGVVGIESYFDDELRGKAGAKSVLVNSLGYRQSENIWSASEPGRNVVLTIDLPLQEAAEKALRKAPRHAGEVTRGAVVVMDVHSGDIYALASSPAFDPNRFIPSITHEVMNELNDPEQRPLINRATQERYAPGSIFKIVTALAGLETGVLNPTNIFYSPGVYRASEHSRPIEDTAPAGNYDFKRAFKLSSNTYFIHYGMLAGVTNIFDMGHRFFLGQRVDIPTLQSDSGIFPNLDLLLKWRLHGSPWNDGDTANLCIGQGRLAVNPVQMAVMTAAIANGGTVFWPRLVQRIESADPMGGEADTKIFPVRRRGELNVKPQHLQIIREAMLADVEDPDGTGRQAAVHGLRLGGKTGTAEVKHIDELTGKNTWFVAFAPYENPKYAVVVMVEQGSSGGGTCAPVARDIFEAILKRSQMRSHDASERVAAGNPPADHLPGNTLLSAAPL
ncbi:MAG: penicillin-binding protein 2 [Verrucomicrobiota bacterium]